MKTQVAGGICRHYRDAFFPSERRPQQPLPVACAQKSNSSPFTGVHGTQSVQRRWQDGECITVSIIAGDRDKRGRKRSGLVW